MSISLTAVVCTHNPRRDYLEATLGSLRAQTLPHQDWEFLLVDNASSEKLSDTVDLSWHPHGRVVREDRVGLTYARLRSYEEARGRIIVYIDDDNILRPDYLEQVVDILAAHPEMGAIGGKSLPRYETEPPAWFHTLGIHLACRDLGDEVLTASWQDTKPADRRYPSCAPVGAGMAIQKTAYARYVEEAAQDPVRTALGRAGQSLASGEDNDIIMTLLREGWHVGYFPQLRLTHLIPARRLTRDYLSRIAYSSSKTWVLVLGVHGLRPWPPIRRWTVPLRKVKSYLAYRAWQDDAAFIRWRGACGQYEGRALLP